jgi:hypothetical protein
MGYDGLCFTALCYVVLFYFFVKIYYGTTTTIATYHIAHIHIPTTVYTCMVHVYWYSRIQ